MSIPTVWPQLFYNGGWVVVPALPEDTPTVIERGYTDEGTIRPSSLAMRVNDSAAPSLNPSRPLSPLYDVDGRAVPVAFSADGSIRAWLESSLLDPDETQEFSESTGHGLRWLDVEAGGPLYRIGQWSDELQSPMTRTFLQYGSLIGYWPGEDSALSTRVGLSRNYAGINLAEEDSPPGAAGSFQGTSSTSVILSPLTSSTSAGFQVFFSTHLPFIPVSPATTPFFTWRANGLLWSLEIDSIAIHLKLYSGGVLIDDSNTALGSTVFTDWVSWRAKCYQSGANVVCELAWYTSRLGIAGITRITPATIDRLTSIRINASTLVDGTHYTQIGALAGVADDLQSLAALRSFDGYAGETTVERFSRLLTESDIGFTIMGTSATLMGPQKTGKLFDLLKEVAATEDGLIFDQRDAINVVLRTRRSRMNQTPVLTLAYGTDIVPPFKERLDNVGVQNVVTIEDRSGATASATRATGPMSAAAYPAGIGVFKGGAYPDVDVNVNDPAEDLQPMADWYLARGTVPGPRFPTVTIEVGLKSPGLRTAAKALEIGDRITVTGRLPDPIDLHVIGIKEQIETMRWPFTLTCIPGTAFDTGAEDSTDHLLDTYANTIITAPSPASTGTSMVVGSPDPDDVWSTTSLPYPIMVSGEKMTVTACTAAALVSGTYRQTLTVTRSVNGVVKAQLVGTEVHVFTPIREAW